MHMFWALLRTHFNPRLAAQTKLSPSRAPNIFMSTNINCFVLIFWDIEKFIAIVTFGQFRTISCVSGKTMISCENPKGYWDSISLYYMYMYMYYSKYSIMEIYSFTYHHFRWYATLENKTPTETFQNFCQSRVLSTDQIHQQIHQSQPLVWPSDLLYVMLAGCDWWILIWHVDNMCSKIDGNFGIVSAGVLFSKVAYQRKRW